LALAVEACRRTLGIVHFPVQILGALSLLNGRIVEMQTGEGKTVTAVLPAAYRAMQGLGCHVVTSNDYLAKRDAELLAPAYQLLGLSVGCVQQEMSDDDRREAYSCDITYSTAVQFGFDFLRDRLKLEDAGGLNEPETSPLVTSTCVQRGQYFALIDEADNILIDEAGTPMVIAIDTEPKPGEADRLQWVHNLAEHLNPDEDFAVRPRKREVWLTEAGCRRISLIRKPDECIGCSREELFQLIEKSLSASLFFHRDTHYITDKDGVIIIDEGTGRKLMGRKWQDGLHQAVEVKEGMPPSAHTSVTARVTIQTFYRRYTHLAGMTGTGQQARREFKQVYKLRLRRIPTNRPCLRRGESHLIYASLDDKWRSVANEIQRLTNAGRAILVGTCSVIASESLSQILSEFGIEHVLLNARRDAEESRIVAAAGQSGAVTIATNMAGRGTDIPLDDRCRAAGGLHVIATEMHTSRRIDRQLIGRAARQGDPGSYRFILSLEDELLKRVSEAMLIRLRQQASEDGRLPGRLIRIFRQAQTYIESSAIRSRTQVLKAEQNRIKVCRKLRLEPTLEMIED